MGKHAAPKYTGTHRKAGRKVRIAAASGIAAVTVAAGVLAAAPANAQTQVNWTQRAYSAFTTWEAHPTRANLDALVADSFHLPAKYDAADIAQLYADVMGGAKATYVSDDKQYVAEDLDNCSGC